MKAFYSVCLAIVFFTAFTAKSQTSVTTGLPSSASSLSGTNPGITFIVTNSNAYPIAITAVDCYRSSNQNGNTFYLKYSSTSLSGPATTTSWTTIATVVASSVSTTAIHPTFSGMNFTIPGNTTYRFSMETNGSTLNYGGAATTPNSFTNGGVTIGNGNYTISGQIVGYSGAGGNISLFSPRFWCGTIYFVPASANNLQAIIMSQPQNNAQHCYNTNIPVKAVIKNVGSAAQSNFGVSAFYQGTFTGLLTANYPGTLASGATDTVNFGTLNLQPGNYSIYAYTMLGTDTLKGNDTTPTVNFVVKQPVLPPQAISDTVCAGDNATIYVNTQSSTTYKWYSAATGGSLLSTGDTTISFSPLAQDTTMYVAASFGGCESQRVPITAAIGPAPVVNFGDDTTFCESIPLVLDAGNPGGTYLWSTGATTKSITLTTQSGTYWVVVDKYCIASDTINVTIAPMPKAAGISYIRTGNSYHFSASGLQNVDSYLWIFGDGNTSTLQNPVHTFGPNINVDLMVKLVVYNNCGTDTVLRLVPTAVEATEALSASVELYPNPAANEVFIRSQRAAVEEVYILNAAGSVVLKHSVPGTASSKLDISRLASGNYIVRIRTDEGTVHRILQVHR